MEETDLRSLRKAKMLLENPSFAVKLTNLAGKPIEKGMQLLPNKWSRIVNKAVNISLNKALSIAVKSIGKNPARRSNERAHSLTAALSGGIGGAFGFSSLIIELPISTTIMLRSIADIARDEGED
ncbi:EcsC family protein, partial [Candidatus Roizmanbacteria bacterium]|nr:EcsC family protein [Candidatus Roizmanbacteria bacterium]